MRVGGGVGSCRIRRFWWWVGFVGLFFVFLVCRFRLGGFCLKVGLFLWVFLFVCSICLLRCRCSSVLWFFVVVCRFFRFFFFVGRFLVWVVVLLAYGTTMVQL